jgi:flagellar biosynthesis chaperone FliJ
VIEVVEQKSTLEFKLDNLEKENEILVLKIKELEKKINKVEENTSAEGKTNLDLNERQNLKNQIDDLISRIDYHIRS